VEIRTLRKGGATTGTFDTEIVSMSLSGDVGGVHIDVRESPGRESPGETRIDDIGGGEFQIDSFFDVFVELSVDGGPFMLQTNEATRMDLVPEPSELLLWVAGVGALRWMARRREKQRRTPGEDMQS
jgi:hypothetical protein